MQFNSSYSRHLVLFLEQRSSSLRVIKVSCANDVNGVDAVKIPMHQIARGVHLCRIYKETYELVLALNVKCLCLDCDRRKVDSVAHILSYGIPSH